MRLKVILNRIEKHAGFIYERVRVVEEHSAAVIAIVVRPRVGSRAMCGGCGQARRGYDTLAARRYEYVPLWGVRVYFVYAKRRVACARCGVVGEAVPWAVGKHRLTWSYVWFLARWAKRLSWADSKNPSIVEPRPAANVRSRRSFLLLREATDPACTMASPTSAVHPTAEPPRTVPCTPRALRRRWTLRSNAVAPVDLMSQMRSTPSTPPPARRHLRPGH